MPRFFGLLEQLEGYRDIRSCVEQGERACVSGLSGANRAHVLFSLLHDTGKKNCLVIAPNDESARMWYRDLSFFLDQRVFLFPGREFVFYDMDTVSRETAADRISILQRLAGEGGIVVASAAAACAPVLSLTHLKDYTLSISEGEELSVDELLTGLAAAGYSRCETVEGKGQFAFRGGILDVFPINSEQPVRVELFGDEVDTIRTFDVFTQLSVERISTVTIPPARELLYSREQAERAASQIEAFCPRDAERLREEGYFPSDDKYLPLFYDQLPLLSDYFGEDALLLLDDPAALREKTENAAWEVHQAVSVMIEQGKLGGVDQDYCLEYDGLLHRLGRKPLLSFCPLLQSGTGISYKKLVTLEVKTQSAYNGNMTLLLEDLKLYQRQNYTVIMLAGSRSRGMMLADHLRESGQPAVFDESPQGEPKGMVVTTGSLSEGFEYPSLRLAVISDRDIFKKKQEKKRRKSKDQQKILNVATDLSPGDYVVHVNHGIGQYLGQELVTAGGITKDYLKIRYGGTDMLYVPATQLDLIHKYVGAKSELKLNKLGGKEWNKVKSRVRAGCADLADGLIKLYAARQNIPGHAFSPDTPWQQEFEESFPYLETEDQLKCIAEVKKDMERPVPMDRLLCGDVGYGKTEVAIRAAFKCVMDNCQVAYLAPTTILALQHYQNFKKRMEPFAVRVEMLSRFRTAKEQRDILERLAQGQIDILIGTHRILQKDLKFSSLGLLIVDEEQRFGVAHKERLKEIKQDVDVLTMTATPIPRTLHMSMIGIRDISVISTPPRDRYPVRTYVMEHNDSVVQDAIVRELARGGQVYYLYNRVEGISSLAHKISQLVPSARVEFAHGQMREGELEKIMLSVAEGEIDVLVCTTIIETGLDIPNVNTILIENADCLGLSQLYQLRGRVGRSDRMAYAYLMYQKDKVLDDAAQKRLIALRDFTEFGSGFKIALRDLEIRGAGNVLGAEQHGHMDQVGYELYCDMLEQEVRRRNGEVPEETREVQVDLQIDAYLPKSYVPGEQTRMDLYRRIAKIASREDYNEMADELCDRFGDSPACVMNLLEVALVKNTAGRVGITEIRQNGENLNFYWEKISPQLMQSLSQVIAEYKLLFSAGNKPCLTFRKGAAQDADRLLSNIKIILQRIWDLQFDEK
ncbi:MAG: transcription-repair coupling factor [Clostridia bacterium]|nr:transcription-repair coupling factor [Clostridia bacterium]